MGIKDLLRLLEPSITENHISTLSGKSVAIDASSWLHKAVYASAEDYVDSNFKDNQLYVDFILIRINDLRCFGIQPVMVFDGKRVAMKAETNAKRQETRQQHIEHGRKLMENLRCTSDKQCIAKLRQEAIHCFQRGMSVTPEMEMNLIAALRRLSIPVIVAPNEADSQLAYLCVSGRCQAVMTEDSDILVYSAVCGVPFQILYKYDKQRETVQSIDMSKIINMEEDGALDTCSDNNNKCNNEFEDLEECDFADEGDENHPNIGGLSRSNSVTSVSSVSSDGSLAGKKRKKDSKAGFLAQLKSHFHGINGRRMFVQMCILAGCDYNDSIYGVGLITAMQAILQHKNSPNNQRLRSVCKYFISQNKSVTEAYIKRIMKSEQMFFYPFVYNPSIHAVRHFMDPNVIDEQRASVELEGESANRLSSQISSIGNGQAGSKRRKSYNVRNGESLTISMNRQDEPCPLVEASRSPSCSADQSSPFIGESEAMELQQALNTINAGFVNIEGQHASDLKSISISDICEGKVFSIRGMGNASSVNSHNAGGAILSDPSSYRVIVPGYPWETGRCQSRPQHRSQGGFALGLWQVRANLMKLFGGNGSGTGGSSGNMNIQSNNKGRPGSGSSGIINNGYSSNSFNSFNSYNNNNGSVQVYSNSGYRPATQSTQSYGKASSYSGNNPASSVSGFYNGASSGSASTNSQNSILSHFAKGNFHNSDESNSNSIKKKILEASSSTNLNNLNSNSKLASSKLSSSSSSLLSSISSSISSSSLSNNVKSTIGTNKISSIDSSSSCNPSDSIIDISDSSDGFSHVKVSLVSHNSSEFIADSNIAHSRSSTYVDLDADADSDTRTTFNLVDQEDVSGDCSIFSGDSNLSNDLANSIYSPLNSHNAGDMILLDDPNSDTLQTIISQTSFNSSSQSSTSSEMRSGISVQSNLYESGSDSDSFFAFSDMDDASNDSLVMTRIADIIRLCNNSNNNSSSNSNNSSNNSDNNNNNNNNNTSKSGLRGISMDKNNGLINANSSNINNNSENSSSDDLLTAFIENRPIKASSSDSSISGTGDLLSPTDSSVCSSISSGFNCDNDNDIIRSSQGAEIVDDQLKGVVSSVVFDRNEHKDSYASINYHNSSDSGSSHAVASNYATCSHSSKIVEKAKSSPNSIIFIDLEDSESSDRFSNSISKPSIVPTKNLVDTSSRSSAVIKPQQPSNLNSKQTKKGKIVTSQVPHNHAITSFFTPCKKIT